MRWITRGAVVATVAILCPLGISQLTATEMAGPIDDPTPVTASVRRADPLRVEDVLHAFGHVAPADIIRVSMPRHAAPVTDILVNEGDRVDAGQILVRIDRTDIQRDLLQAQATLSATRADIRIARSSLQVAATDIAQRRAELDRLERLAKTGASSEVQRQDATRALQQAMSEHEAAKARLAGAQASETLALLALERVTTLSNQLDIRAPVAGRVTRIMVDPGATPVIGSPVLDLAAADRMEAVLTVPPHALARVSRGTPVRLWTPDGTMIAADVARISPSTSPEAGLARVAVRLPDGHAHLAGSSLRAEIIVDQRVAIIVPTSALVALDSGPGLFRVVDQRAVATPVDLSMRPGGAEAEIVAGLSEGAVYVAVASPLLRDGEPVAHRGDLKDIGGKQTAALHLGLARR
jgi:RND family efflux transporter MFP subunit